MKKLIIAITMLFGIATTNCTSMRNAGSLNMVSTRNIDASLKYKVIQKTELTNRDKKRSRAETIESAIDVAIKKVEGGEYLMNARVYLIKHDYFFSYAFYYAVDGDIWGVKK